MSSGVRARQKLTLDIDVGILYNEPVFQESEITVQIRVSKQKRHDTCTDR